MKIKEPSIVLVRPQLPENIGLTAGASAPEILVEEVKTKLKKTGASIVTESPGIKESVVFSLPRELMKQAEKIG